MILCGLCSILSFKFSLRSVDVISIHLGLSLKEQLVGFLTPETHLEG